MADGDAGLGAGAVIRPGVHQGVERTGRRLANGRLNDRGCVVETVIEVVALIALVAVVRAAAHRARLLDPILLLLVGVGLAFVPGVPPYRLDPELVLVAVLPLLLYGTAFNTSLPTFRANARSIVLLSVGLTLFTTVVVGGE